MTNAGGDTKYFRTPHPRDNALISQNEILPCWQPITTFAYSIHSPAV